MKKLSGLKIVSDGSVMGTRIYSPEGEDITAKLECRGVQFQHRAGGVPLVVLTCNLAAIEADNIEGLLMEENIREVSTLDDEYRRYEKII